MMKRLSSLAPGLVPVFLLSASLLSRGLSAQTGAQTVNAAQQVTLQGLRTSAGHGNFTAAQFAPNGSLFLLLNQNDGVRLLKTDPTGASILAQAQTGAAGDAALAMALDPSGNVYVTGTSTSGSLNGTTGAAFPASADTSTNSFLAKYDTNLNLIFLTFLGAGRTAASAVAASADGAFVTGITFNSAFPVTPAGIQQAPASGSSENGFVERFSASGSTLVYATYLTGANGTTAPTGIAVDAGDNAYITGSTGSTGYPTTSALVPRMLGTNSGFLTELNPTGSDFTFSTFVPGAGLNSIAYDGSTASVLLSGNISLGQFPIATVAMPLVATSYQSLLRIPANGQSVSESVLLVPGSQSFVSVGPTGTAWVSGALTVPLFPGAAQPYYPAGDSFLLHLTSPGAIDQTLRFGGLPATTDNFASLASTVAAPAVNAAGTGVALPGTITASVTSSLLATERFDLPLVQAPNTVLPNLLRDALSGAGTCNGQCSGSAGLLSMVTTATSSPSFGLAVDDLPNLTLRNLGSTAATGLAVTASGYTVSTDCGTTLQPSSACSIALTGAGPGTITVSSANAATYTLPLPADTLTPDPLALSTNELDFGVVTSVSGAVQQTLTVTNLSAATQTFASVQDGGPVTAYSFTQAAATCPAADGGYSLAAGASCTITLALTASATSSNDGLATALWKIATRDIKLTGFSQAAALNLSATEIDFGTQFSGSGAPQLPRYLYISNNSTMPVAHSAAALPAGSPFTVADNCASVLEPHSVCQIALAYNSATVPSSDTATLLLDDGLSVLLTGETLQPATVTGSSADPNLSVSPSSITFASPVAASGTSGTTTQTVTISNTGSAAFPLSLSVTGDFAITSNCPATLAGDTSCTVLVTFAPSQPGARDGLLSVTGGSNFAPAYVTLSGTGSAILPANDGTLNLGQTVVGEPEVAFFPVQQPLPSLTVTSSNPLFGVAIVQNTGLGQPTLPSSTFAPTATGACASCWIAVQFLAQTPDTEAATLTITSASRGSPYAVTLTASAVAVTGLLFTPVTQDFGTVPVHSTSAPFALTLANLLPGSSGVTITSVAATGDFSIDTNSTGGASCSGTLPPQASCYINVLFAPTATGQRIGSLTVVTSGGTATAPLTGDGVPDPGLSLSPDALIFNAQPGPAATSQTITVANTGSATLTFGPLVVSDPTMAAGTNCTTLTPAATCSITVQFTATSALVSASLSIPVTSTLNGQTTSSVYTVPLTGGYTTEDAGLQLLPGQVNFGSEPTGTMGLTRQFSLNNLTQKTLAVTLNLPRQFPLADAGACATLAPGASCAFSVSFLPETAGALTGTVFATGSPTDGSASVQTLTYLLGYDVGSGALTLTGNLIPNTPLNFGTLASGQTSQQTLTLTNSGSSVVTIRRITSDPPFLSTTSCGAALAANASCTVTLTYAPIDQLPTGATGSTSRLDEGDLIIESDAASGPLIEELTGTATPIFSGSPASSAVLATLNVSQGALSFSNTAVGSASQPQTLTLTNAGNVTLHIPSVLPPTDFTQTSTCATLLPGATCTITVTFAPTVASSASVRAGTLEIASDATTSLEFVSLFGISSASPLTLTPTALNFGTVNVGATDTLPLAITNTTAAPVLFNGITSTGDFTAARGTCPANGSTLAAGAICTLQLTFAPSAAGARTGTLSLSTDATTLPLTVTLTGIGATAQLQVTPGALAFGSIAVGAPASLTLTLLNTGTAELTGIATTLSGPNAADFAVTVPCSVTQLAPNQGCTVTVTFTPSAIGARSATLSIASSDAASPALVPLTGAGAQAGSFTLTVAGASSASATVPSGSPATFALTLTPLNGFTGAVALTCTPVTIAPYGSCSLLASSLILNGAAQSSTATINTITSQDGVSPISLLGISLVFAPALVLAGLGRRRGARSACILLLTGCAWTMLSGCGTKPAPTSNLRYTPAGAYQYQVTASSTSGPQISSTVTLNLIVQ